MFSINKKFLVIVISLLLVSCQVTYKKPPFEITVKPPVDINKSNTQIQLKEKNQNFTGFGISINSGQVIEKLENNNIILNRFGTAAPVIIEQWEYELVSETHEQLNIVYQGELIKFQQPARINKHQLDGQWFSYEHSEGFESSQVVTYGPEGYHFDKVELYHVDEGYSHISRYTPFHFTHGFVFEEYYEYGESYWYFLIEASEDKMVYIDEDGVIRSEERFIDQWHLEIPDYYYNESF